MINGQQLDLLESLIGNDGIYLYVIKEYSRLDLSTKLLYLERAMSDNQDVFFQSLDLIYDPNLGEEEQRENLEFIRALKVVNDFCFNNPVRYAEFGARNALDHYFASLGEVQSEEFQATTRRIIREQVSTLSAEHTDAIIAGKQARVRLESTLSPQSGWRERLFPEAHSPEPFQDEALLILFLLVTRVGILHTHEALLENTQRLFQHLRELNRNLRELQELEQRIANLQRSLEKGKREFDDKIFNMQILGGFISVLGSLAVATSLTLLATATAFNVTLALAILGSLGLLLGAFLFSHATTYIFILSQKEISILNEAQKISVGRTYLCMQVLEGFFAVLGSVALVLAFAAATPVMTSAALVISYGSIAAEIGFFAGAESAHILAGHNEPSDQPSRQPVV